LWVATRDHRKKSAPAERYELDRSSDPGRNHEVTLSRKVSDLRDRHYAE
jgi:hypothetical protein